MKKIYVDCSYLSEHIELNTGIQRVVRRIIENLTLLSKENDFEVVAVNISNSQFKKVEISDLYQQTKLDKNDHESKEDFLQQFKNYLKNLYRATRDLIAALIPHKKVKLFLYAPKEKFGLRYIVELIVVKPVKFIINQNKKNKTVTNDIQINKEDVLLLLDSTWYMDIWSTVKMAKENGAQVIAVIYDLIPITHPQFCDNFLVEVFKTWFSDSLKYVDGFITISDTVKKDLISFLKTEFKDKVFDKKFDYFLLGSDFNYHNIKDEIVRDELKVLFEKKSTYLIVCTIEPRKNHLYLIDAFDKLWEKGFDVNLCIVGRVGWKVEKTMDRINTHKLLGKRLFHFADLNDKELQYCYKNSKMLIFPSIVEGFGLPIVESLMYHLPVLASDTPIHREVGGDKIGYFDLDDSSDLVNQLIKIENEGIPPYLIPSDDYKWQSWQESTKMLLDKMKKMSKE